MGNTFPTYLAKLTRLQKKAIRLVTSSDWNVSAAPLFNNTNVLPFPELIKFEIAKILYNYNNNCLPPSFDHYFALAKDSHSRMTRFSSQEQMVIPFHKTNRLQRSIKYVGPKIWNSIPLEVRKFSFNRFNKCYKNLLMNSPKNEMSETIPLFFAINVVHSLFRLCSMKSLIRFYVLIW